MVGDHCAEEAVVWEGRIVAGVRDGAGQADGFEWGGGVIELDEGFDAVGVGSGKSSVEGVETAVEAGAGVKQDRQGRVRPSGTEGEVDGGQGLADGDGNWWQAGGRDGREGMGEGLDVEDKLTVALGVWC
eukprot:scaffold4173_cov109-Amphora_coffeaeformis.AAC.1